MLREPLLKQTRQIFSKFRYIFCCSTAALLLLRVFFCVFSFSSSRYFAHFNWILCGVHAHMHKHTSPNSIQKNERKKKIKLFKNKKEKLKWKL